MRTWRRARRCRARCHPGRARHTWSTLDVGIVHDRTVLTVMHAEDTAAGRRVVLDRIDRWQGSRAAPVDLAAVRDTLIARAAEYLADAVVDPHQAVLIAQEARAAGVPGARVHVHVSQRRQARPVAAPGDPESPGSAASR